MVKRVISYVVVLFILFCLVCPAFAVDEIVYPIDVLGVGFYRENRIDVVARNGILRGSDFSGFVSDLTARYKPDYFKIYIPVTSEDYNFVYVTLSSPYSTGTYSVNYGTFSNNDFTSSGSADFVRTLVGYTNVYGVNYLSQRFKITVPDNFGGFNNTFFCISCPVPSVGFKLAETELGQALIATLDSGSGFTSSVNDTLSGRVDLDHMQLKENSASGDLIPGNSTFSIAKNGVSLSGSSTAVYVSGRLRTDASSTYTLGSTSSTITPWLQVPSQTISLKNSTSAITGSVTNTSGSITIDDHYSSGTSSSYGTLSGTNVIPSIDFTTDQQSITGTLSDGVNYADTVVILSAQASNDDSDLIQAVNDASALNHSDITSFSNRMHTDINAFYNRNHNDLTKISNQLGELVEHQQQVEQAGEGVAGTTSTQTIQGTSGDLSTGTQALDQSISTVGDISSFVSSSTPYMNLLSIGLGVMWNFGNGVIGWAVLALIVLSVILYILGRISE